MKEWQKAHKCKMLCKKLGLKDIVVEIKDMQSAPKTCPLHHGFSPKCENND